MKKFTLSFVLILAFCYSATCQIEASRIFLHYDVATWRTGDGKKISSGDNSIKVYSQEMEFLVAPEQEVTFDLVNVPGNVTVYTHPGAYDEAVTANRSFQFSLSSGETFLIKLQNPGNGTNRSDQLLVRISTSQKPDKRGNPSFLFVSGIRSVGNENYDNQWVDLNLKKNLLDGRLFVLLSTDLSLSKKEENDTLALNQTQLVEAGLSLNHFVFFKNKYTLNNLLKRTAFIGGGMKIFNQQPMCGVHAGVMEVNGPLFTSYSYIGYYRNIYELPVRAHADSGQANYFRNNIYLESALMIDPASQESEFLQSLSRVRIKLGVLFPFGKQAFLHPTNAAETRKLKPTTNDIQYRIVMEIPLGKIFRF